MSPPLYLLTPIVPPGLSHACLATYAQQRIDYEHALATARALAAEEAERRKQGRAFTVVEKEDAVAFGMTDTTNIPQASR